MQDYLEIRELYHHGIKGQKWGERRFQNPDGTLTKEGIARYRKDLQTQEMIKNSTNYDKLTKKQQKQYIDYGRKAGAKKGAITGAALGAATAIGKRIVKDVSVTSKKHPLFKKDVLPRYSKGFNPYSYSNGRRMINSYLRSAALGAIGGSVLGTIIGGKIGKNKAKARLADKGKEYTNELLDTPINNIQHSDESNNYLELSEINVSDEFLEHHGIKDQKWGIRRYQNPDGSLTEEGRKRYNPGAPDKITKEHNKKSGETKYYYTVKDDNGNEKRVDYKYRTDQLDDNDLKDLNARASLESKISKDAADADKRARESIEKSATQPYKDTKDILDSSAKVLDATARALPTGNGKTIRKDYSGMSDQELRTKISRLQLEESYGKLTGDTKYVKSGSEKAKEILQTTGAVLAIGMSAAALAETISRLRARKKPIE